MGMGKTSAALYAINLLQSVEGVGPALILAPLRVAVSTWPDEVAKWEDFSHMRVSVLYGSKAQRKKALNEKADIYCVNYESLPGWSRSSTATGRSTSSSPMRPRA